MTTFIPSSKYPNYVYMLLCADEGPIYVKVGITDRPTQRMAAIATGCPVPMISLSILETSCRKAARDLERALHLAFGKWRTKGEWFQLVLEDKKEFNEAWKAVFSVHSTPSYRLKWSHISVDALDEMRKENYREYRKSLRFKGSTRKAV
jgi:hypothetical protein